MTGLRHLALISGLLLLGACAPRPAVKPSPAALPVVPAETLVTAVEANGQAIHALKGLAKARVTTPDGSVTATQVLLVKEPDLLRAESLSPFGTPLMVLTTDGKTLSVLLPGKGRFLTGPASPRNLRRFTRLPLRPTDLVGLLLYRPPVLPWSKARAEAMPGTGYRLELIGAEGQRQVFLLDARRRLTGAAYYSGDDLLLDIRYNDLTKMPVVYPTSAKVSMPAYHLSASLRFDDDVTINPELDDQTFRLQPPPGVAVEEL